MRTENQKRTIEQDALILLNKGIALKEIERLLAIIYNRDNQADRTDNKKVTIIEPISEVKA